MKFVVLFLKIKKGKFKMKLYVYDHCPYCVRVMLTIGLKKIDCPIDYFLNDDEDGPISRIGSKQCPILEKDDGSFMLESLDIVAYLEEYDGKTLYSPSENRKDLEAWIADSSMLFRNLLMPRWVLLNLPEFATQSARDYFTRKKTKMIGDFTECLNESESLIAELEIKLCELQKLFVKPLTVNKSLSYDDLDLWSRLRGLTCVKGLNIPEGIKNYIDYYAKLSNVPLYYGQEI